MQDSSSARRVCTALTFAIYVMETTTAGTAVMKTQTASVVRQGGFGHGSSDTDLISFPVSPDEADQ